MRFFLLTALLCSPLAFASGQDSLTVESVLDQVLKNNPSIQQSEFNLEASKARVGEAESSYLPSFDVDASYVRLGPVPTIGFGGLVFKLYPENNYDGHVSGRYTLYDFGMRSAAVDLSQSMVRLSADGVDAVRENLRYQTTRLFYTILFLQESGRVQDEEIETLNEHLRIAQEKERTGSATSFDVLTTRVRVGEAQKQRTDIRNALEKQQATLRQLMGLPAGSPIDLSGTFDTDTSSASVDRLLDLAAVQRPDLRLARDQEAAAQMRVRSRAAADRPVLRLHAMYGVKNGYIPNLDVLRGNWNLGVQAQVPLLDGGRTSHQVEEAEWELRAAAERVREVSLKVRADIEQALSDFDAARVSTEISRLQTMQARDAYDLARRRYDAGSSTNLDVLDAATRLAQSRLGFLRARYQLRLAVAELQHVSGSGQVHGGP